MMKKNHGQHSQAQSSNEWEQMESTFIKCLHEIERSYIHLPKILRIRVEKWIEKLVATGNNVVWRKHRNAYARLLLNMVITRNLSEPFNLLPPDGPLPSFPFHMTSNKDLLGPHETSFWRNMYHRLQDCPKENAKNGLSLADVTRSVDLTGGTTNMGFGLNREINNLNLLIREQNERIQLLEQQLHEERVKHELQIQRLHYTHRTEINQLLSSSNDGNGNNHIISAVISSKEFNSKKIQSYSVLDSNIHASADYNRFGLSSNQYRLHDSMTPQRSHSPSSIPHSRVYRYEQSNDEFQRNSREPAERFSEHLQHVYHNKTSDAPQYYSSIQGDSSMYAPNGKLASPPEQANSLLPTNVPDWQQIVDEGVSHHKKVKHEGLCGEETKDRETDYGANNPIDIVPFPKHTPNFMPIDASTINHATDSSSIHHKFTSELPSSIPVLSEGHGSRSPPIDSPSSQKQDDDFLNYLDKFQTELRKVQIDVNLLDDAANLPQDSLHI
jgi:hypothetical protein